MTIVRTDRPIDTLVLKAGGHKNADDGGCIMEWASYLAGERWTDAPECVAPSIRQFCMSWNDALPDADRTRLLLPFLPKVIGTNTGNVEHELERFWLLADWTVRVSTPAWLRLAGLEDDVLALEQLAELRTPDDLAVAQPLLNGASERARAAGATTWAAAWAAAAAAAWAAAWDAAWAAAAAAAWAAAWDAARAAAWDELAPTVASLQASACELLDRLCAVGRESSAAGG